MLIAYSISHISCLASHEPTEQGGGRKRRTHWNNKQRIFKFPRWLYYTILPRIIQFPVLLNRIIRFTFLPAFFQFWQTCGVGETGGPTCRPAPFPHCHDRCIQFHHMADQGPDSVVWQGPPPNPTLPHLTLPYLTLPTLPYPTLPYHGYVKGVINVV